MKRLVAVLSMLACGPRAAPTVSLAERLPVPEPRDVGVTLLGDCRIVGTGERAREGDAGAPFEVFESNETREAAFVIARPERAHVVWSHFPARADDGRTRARVGLGGQGVRYDGWAGLYGRTFTTTRRMDSVTGHLWARAGAPVDIMSAGAGGTIFARAPTPFAAPRTIVVQGNCADVRYQPEAPPARPPRAPGALVNRNASFKLFASPTDGTPFTTITLGERALVLDVVEQRPDFVHVVADEAYVGLDAWVPAAQLVSDRAHPMLAGFQNDAPEPEPPLPRIARVARDTQLYTGFEPTLVRGAVVEASAVVRFDPRLETVVDGVAFVPFELADGFVVAPEGSHLWIAKDVLLSAR